MICLIVLVSVLSTSVLGQNAQFIYNGHPYVYANVATPVQPATVAVVPVIDANIAAFEKFKADPAVASATQKLTCGLKTLSQSACELANAIQCDASTLDELYNIYSQSAPTIPGVTPAFKFPPGILKIDPVGKAKAGDLLCDGTIQLAKMSCDLADYIAC